MNSGKDWKKRRDDYHSKERRIKAMTTKAANKNEDEFYFGMIKSKTRDGVHVAERLSEGSIRLGLFPSSSSSSSLFSSSFFLFFFEHFLFHVVLSFVPPRTRHVPCCSSRAWPSHADYKLVIPMMCPIHLLRVLGGRDAIVRQL